MRLLYIYFFRRAPRRETNYQKEWVDYLNEFVSRLGRVIEPYLKIIIVSIYNLQKIYQNRDFYDFYKGFGYYLSPRCSLHIQHSKKVDYVDYRNAISIITLTYLLIHLVFLNHQKFYIFLQLSLKHLS